MQRVGTRSQKYETASMTSITYETIPFAPNILYKNKKGDVMRLPKDMKLSPHARQRLLERKDADMKYNTSNIMRSSIKWYGKDDLIHDCALYRHCCYTTRKSNQIGYITDGDIEVIYNKGTHVAITVLEVKDKFKPITQFIKPEILRYREKKKERIKMEKEIELKPKNICADCGKERELNSHGICVKCVRRKNNMKAKGKTYIRYLDLSKEEQLRVDKAIEGQSKRRKALIEPEPEPELTVPDNNTYYSSKANGGEAEQHPMMKPIKKVLDPLSDRNSFIKILKECDCEIPDESLEDMLDILMNTDKLKNVFTAIAKSDNQRVMLDLEQTLNVTEKKLQRDWEDNGFREMDDIKFKGFLTWRRALKGAICFWKKLYQTNTIAEIQRAMDVHTQDHDGKTLFTTTEDRADNTMKRFQITTDSISTIFNTRRPFTRVFYAIDKDGAYNMFKQWMADRNLHEDPKKTSIVELQNDGSENPRRKDL